MPRRGGGNICIRPTLLSTEEAGALHDKDARTGKAPITTLAEAATGRAALAAGAMRARVAADERAVAENAAVAEAVAIPMSTSRVLTWRAELSLF